MFNCGQDKILKDSDLEMRGRLKHEIVLEHGVIAEGFSLRVVLMLHIEIEASLNYI